MKIDDIKDPQIRALAWKYRKANKNKKYNEDSVYNGFDWDETKEGIGFWCYIDRCEPIEITEKMKADHPEIFLKQEEMKTTHTLENGTVLEVGKKYTLSDWRKACYYEILFLGEKCFVVKDEINREKAFEYPNWNTLIPYEEPKEKIFENYKPYICHNSFADLVKLDFRKSKPLNGIHTFYYTLEEAKEQGLDLSIFNI